ncbi:hypothetical protein [Rufibacter psychrotolerans]|uniref:hypothetical protein n=1 Tax=Rufibacter psychrotolerans TaxID=2812556 RepID=UPI0019683D0D|nr:hypothetical protein [Rufibacter sp. SYSU D00308]
MKGIVVALALVFWVSTAHSQDIIDPVDPKQELLTLSRNQKSAGWVFLAAGLGLIGSAGAVYKPNVITWPPAEKEDNTLSAALAVAGIGSLIGGTSFLIAARRNKKKAMYLETGYTPLPVLQRGQLTSQAQPTLSLKVSF